MANRNAESTDQAFQQGINAHADALITGTQQLFNRIGIEHDIEELKGLMLQQSQAISLPLPTVIVTELSPIAPFRRSQGGGAIPRRETRTETRQPVSYTRPVARPLSYRILHGNPPDGFEHITHIVPEFLPSPLEFMEMLFGEQPHTVRRPSSYTGEELCAIYAGGVEYEKTETCGICLDELGLMTEQNLHAELPCKHRYHTDCIKPWLGDATTCPTCRRDIDIIQEDH